MFKIIFFLFSIGISGFYFGQIGCTDPQAQNYNPSAAINDGSCIYATTNFSPVLIADLPANLAENSGLTFYNNSIYSINDGGNATIINELSQNGSLILRDVEILVDSFQGNSVFKAEVGQILGRQEYDVLLRGNTWRYPFDNYEDVVSIIDPRVEQGGFSIKEKVENLPGFITSSDGIPNYIDKMYPQNSSLTEKIVSDLEQGQVTIQWSIKRQPGDVYAAILLAILMLISAAASFAVTRAVWSGKRPPSINTLAWLAAFLFAMFQIRSSLPGDPPNGNLYDLLIFYPILLILLLQMAIVVYLWIKRDDWDLKNVQPHSY
jgi:hypothetical protein